MEIDVLALGMGAISDPVDFEFLVPNACLGWSSDHIYEGWNNQSVGWRADIYWQSDGTIAY